MDRSSKMNKSTTEEQQSHTIILAQFTDLGNSKCYSDHPTLSGAMDAICQLFEARLRSSSSEDTTYGIQDLFKFIDEIPDIVVLVFNKATSSYVPHNKQWIKDTCYQMFKNASA